MIKGAHDVTLPVVIEEAVSEFHRPSLIRWIGDVEVGFLFRSEGGVTRLTNTVLALHSVRGDILNVNERIGLTLGFLEELEFFGGEAGGGEAVVDGAGRAAGAGLESVGDVQVPEDAPGLDGEPGDAVADVDDLEEVGPVGVVAGDGVGADEAGQVVGRDTEFLGQLAGDGSVLGGGLCLFGVVEEETEDDDKADDNEDIKSHCDISCGCHLFTFIFLKGIELLFF